MNVWAPDDGRKNRPKHVQRLTEIYKLWNLCVLDRTSSWYLNKGRPTRWHLLYYLLLNMFQTFIRTSSGSCDYLLRCVGWLEACWCGIVCWWCGIRVQAELGYHISNSQSRYITSTLLKSAQYSLHNNAPSSRKLLTMDVLTSETCWAVNWHYKASVIKFVYLYSNIKMMHGPIRLRFTK